MLRAVCEKTRAIELIGITDCNLACAIRSRLDETRPALKPHVDSGHVPESNQSMVDRLPDPAEAQLSTEEVNRRRVLRYAHA